MYTACRPVVERFGLWDQIRVDQGKEWVLILYAQETLAHLTTQHQPCSTPSKHIQTGIITVIVYTLLSSDSFEESYSGAHLG